ncbi:MAG: ribonuclease D, partial [Pseudomonadota bacterium]
MNIITDTNALTELCQSLAKADYVTIDTEFIREKTYYPQLCLIQVANDDVEAIIDPLADGIDLSPLFTLLQDDTVIKVIHGGRQDVEIFYYLSGEIPHPLFDTQIAGMVCGFGDQVGYEAMINKILNIQIDKGSRFTDWSHRPLSDKQLA